MRISQINAVYGFLSTGTIVKDLQQLCQYEGIYCEVVSPLIKGTQNSVYQIGNRFDYKLHGFLSRISGKQGYFSYLPTIRLLRHYDEYKPDIIHLHNIHSCYLNFPMLMRYANKNGIAVVVSLHDCWFYTGGCTHYTHSGCMKWQQNCGKCPQRFEETSAFLWDGSSVILRDKYKYFSMISNLTAVGVSNWIANEAKKTVFRNARCITIYNGIDLKFFSPINSTFRQRNNLEGKFLILAPANKWFLDINRDIFDYFSSHLLDDMHIVFIGKGSKEQLLTNQMTNIGFVSSREDIRAIYSSVDVMVNCTCEESLSLLNVEVQACGTPVVTYSNTGVKETVDNKCGFAVDNRNPKAAWDAMMKVKEKGKKYYSESCQKWIKEVFDRDVNYQKYISMYKQIIKGK